jgi:hypothetical protein
MSQDDERRVHERRAIAIDVSAWSLIQPTHRLSGTTADLGAGGALLRLPGLSEAAVHLEVRLALPRRSLVARGRIVRRQPPDLVAVAFEGLDPAEQARLLAFISGGT